MQKPPVEFVAHAMGMLKELDGIKIDYTRLDASSPAARENEASIRSGVDPTTDLVSVKGTCHHLLLTIYAAREHLLGSIVLILSDTDKTLVNSIQALTRISLEASATCLWLCSPRIAWEERLRRHSQLHLKSSRRRQKETPIDNSDIPSHIRRVSEQIQADCDRLMEFVHNRGWTCRRGKNAGKSPTVKQWVDELPSYSDILKEAAEIAGLPPEYLEALYSISSRFVHADPATMAGGATAEEEDARLVLAVGAIRGTLMFYAVAWSLIARWCSVTFPGDAIRSYQSKLGQFG